MAVADRRAALLAAAVRVIAAGGVARATTRTVAAEAGMPLASFHYVFASRDAMLAELVSAVLDEQRAGIAAMLGDAATLREFVTTAMRAWLEAAIADPAAELALHELLAWSRFADAGRIAEAVYAEYEQTVLGFVAAARQRYGARWSVPDAQVARLVLVQTDGVAARWLVDRDDGAARRMLALGADAVLALSSTAGRA